MAVPKTIKNNLLRVQAAVVTEKANGATALGEAIGRAAEAALTKGMTAPDGTVTREWEAYMALFANSAEQLKRLTTTEFDGTNTYLPRARAYVVANSICAPGTDTATIKGLMGVGDIDAKKPDNNALQLTTDPAVIAKRAIQIP